MVNSNEDVLNIKHKYVLKIGYVLKLEHHRNPRKAGKCLMLDFIVRRYQLDIKRFI